MSHHNALRTLFRAAAIAAAVLASGCADGGGATSGLAVSGSALQATGRYIVKAHNHAAAKAAVIAAGGTIALDLSGHGGFAAQLPEQALKGLSHHPAVEYIEVDAKRYPMAEVTPYGVGMVQADQLSDSGAGSRTVCIIDSGYNLGHEDLPSGANITGSDDLGGAGPWATPEGVHGTHVAGTIAALANNGLGVVGINPNGILRLHIVRVFDAAGWAYSSSLVGALDACEAAGANVVNMSLGGTMKSRFEDKAFAAANGRGVLSIAAAGNDGNTRNSYPASYSSVVSVAAIDDNMNVASFSQQNAAVELAAPGVHVKSTVPMGSGRGATTTVNGVQFASDGLEGTPLGDASGVLVDCGIGDSACPGGGGQICLIARGSIAFSDKVLACQAGGGAGAIIYNNVAGPLGATLGGVVTTIPSVGVSDTDGAAMLQQLGTVASMSLFATNYAYFDGTSMATPHVAGVAALVWSYNPSWTNEQIRSALQATALDLGLPGRDAAYGYGLIQAKAALDYLSAPPPVCTPTEGVEVSCTDGIDNDCDGQIDAADSDCSGGSGGTCDLLPQGASCVNGSDCCSGNCKGKSGSKTCK